MKLAVRGGSTFRWRAGRGGRVQPALLREVSLGWLLSDKYAGGSSKIYLLRRGPSLRIASHSFRSRSVHGLGRQSPARALELTEWELAFAGT